MSRAIGLGVVPPGRTLKIEGGLVKYRSIYGGSFNVPLRDVRSVEREWLFFPVPGLVRLYLVARRSRLAGVTLTPLSALRVERYLIRHLPDRPAEQ